MPPSSQTTPTDALARARTFYAPSVVKKKRETLETLGALLGNDLGRFLCFLPRDALVNSSQEVIDIARRYSTSAWTLFAQYGGEAIEREQAYRPVFEVLHAFGGDTWEQLLPLLSPEDFEKKQKGIVELAKKYGEALPAVMRLFRNDIWCFEAEHGALTDNAKKFYNLTHIPRYVLSPSEGVYDVSLLEEVVKNNDPAYRPNRPLALFVMRTILTARFRTNTALPTCCASVKRTVCLLLKPAAGLRRRALLNLQTQNTLLPPVLHLLNSLNSRHTPAPRIWDSASPDAKAFAKHNCILTTKPFLSASANTSRPVVTSC